MPQAMQHLQNELDIDHLPLIAYNGGLIVENTNILHSTEIEFKVTKGISDFCESQNIHASLYHHTEWYVPEMDYWANREKNNTKIEPVVRPLKTTIQKWEKENKGAHKIMCMAEENEIDKLVNFLDDTFSIEVIGYRSKPTYLEISPKIISKKTAIELLLKLKYPNTSLADVLAFGDNYNDIEMLKAVGMGVAVKNANDEVLAIAKQTTLSNIEDGVAVFLENQFL